MNQAKKLYIWCNEVKIASNYVVINLAKTKLYNKGPKLIINQNTPFDHTQNRFCDTSKVLKIGKLLHQSSIRKSCGISSYEVFQFFFGQCISKPDGLV